MHGDGGGDTIPTRMDEIAIFVLVFAYSLFHMFSFFFNETHSIVLRRRL